jgi:hypothetical protein
MTFTDVKHRQRIAEEPLEEVARYLELRLGTELAAYAVGIPPSDLVDLAGGSSSADQSAERRIRNLYAVAWFLATRDGPGTAYQFLVEPNSELDGRPPAEALRQGVAPQDVWFAAAVVY